MGSSQSTGRRFKSNWNVVYSCKSHVVWSPKCRRQVLVNGGDTRLKEIISQTTQEFRAEGMALEVMADHVHLRLARHLNGRSSRLWRQEFAGLRSRLPTLWTNADFVSTVGGTPLAIIKPYIENQKNI